MKTGEAGISSRTKERLVTNPDVLKDAAELFYGLGGMLQEAATGDKSFAQTSKANGYDWKVVWTLLKTKMIKNCRLENVKDLADAVGEVENEYEQFYRVVFPAYSRETKLPFDYAESVETALDRLPEKERKTMRLRFGIGGYGPHSLEETAQEFGVTRERVRQIEINAIRKLQKPPLSKILTEGLYGYETNRKIQEMEKQAALERAEKERQARLEAAQKRIQECAERTNGSTAADIPIEDLNLSTRSYNCLSRAGIRTLEDLMQRSDRDLFDLWGLGESSLKEIRKKQKGLISSEAE